MPSAESTIIVTGGIAASPSMVRDLPSPALCIAADSGLDHALSVGLRPTVLVGDSDSISATGVQWAKDEEIEIIAFSTDKDFTDTELALHTAISRGATHIVVLSGGGDRLDHTFGAITALGHSSLGNCAAVSARWANHLIHVLHGPRRLELELATHTTFSALALHGECSGVTITGARWPLANETIQPGSSRGVSNTCAEHAVTVTVATGVLTIMIPHYFGAPE